MVQQRSNDAELSRLHPDSSGEDLTKARTQKPTTAEQTFFKHESQIPAAVGQRGGNASLLWMLIFPWIWTLILVVSIIGVVRAYEQKGVITRNDKYAFNVLSTLIILFLGLSFYEAFKSLAKALRPHLISYFKPPPHIEHRLEGFDNLLVVSPLTLESVTWGLKLFCITWIFVNLLAQVSAAVISLTYTVDDGQDYNGTYTQDGTVLSSFHDCYYRGPDKCEGAVQTDILAHAYGENTLGRLGTDLDCSDFTDVQSVIESERDFRYYCRRNTPVQEFAYRFNEYNRNDTTKSYPHFTDRVVTTSSGRCNEYDLVSAEEDIVGDPDRTGFNFISAVKYTYANDTHRDNIFIPTSALGNEGTTYIFRGFETPSNATKYGYGKRGLWMWAFKNNRTDGMPGDQGRKFYECPVSVSTVINARIPAHDIPDHIARQAVASIALQGQFKLTAGAFDWTQWQWYGAGHHWETHGLNNSQIGGIIAEHALVSLAEMVNRNPPAFIQGRVPRLGSELSVRWRYFIPLMAVIVLVDSFVIALTFWVIKKSPRG